MEYQKITSLLGNIPDKVSTTIHRIIETNSSFHVKQGTSGKAQFLFFSSFLLALTQFSFRGKDWALGYNFIKF